MSSSPLPLLPLQTMSLQPLFMRSLVRLVWPMVRRPAESLTTILYYSNHLPRNRNLERLVRHELLHSENYLLHFLIGLMRCFV